jgi:hypothetical protein
MRPKEFEAMGLRYAISLCPKSLKGLPVTLVAPKSPKGDFLLVSVLVTEDSK